MILYNCDVIDGLKKVENASVDLLFIDPPYNLGKKYKGTIDYWKTDEEYLDWCYSWLDLSLQKLKPNGSLYFMSSTQYGAYFDIYLREKMHILSRIIWEYDSSGVQAKKHFGSLYEPIIFAVMNKKNYTFNFKDIMVATKTGAQRKLIDYRKKPPVPYNEEKVPGNVWYFPRVRYRMKEYVEHPSQKPESLLERIIKVSTNETDTVLDLFAGSFSLGMVCKRLNRKYIGIEKSKEYYTVGIERLKNKKEILNECDL